MKGSWKLFAVSLALLVSAGAQVKQQPVYVNFFIHCEASPIRGVPGDVQYEPYSGEGITPRNQYLDKILDLCEKYNFKFEFATTPLFAQQLREDRPEIIERIKRMRIPVSRYPSLGGHVLPSPIGELRYMPGMPLSQLRNRETSWDKYLENEWLAETRTLVPNWRFAGERLLIDNPRAGTPIKFEELPEYRMPKDERRLYGGTLALEEIFGVIPLSTFPPLFQSDSGRFAPSPVQQALGMNSFQISRQPGEAFNAPFQATNRKMLTWFKEHFPVDVPLRADASYGYTHEYQGRHIGLNLYEELVQHIRAHPDEYKIVWPDPESVQYRPENRPTEFFKRTYGVSSLAEVREVGAPLARIRRIDSSIPIREATRSESFGRTGWQKQFLYTLSELGVTSGGDALPDFLRPKTEWVREVDVLAAARSVLDGTSFRGGLGELPLKVKVAGETWTQAKTFLAMASFLEQFGLYDRMPAGLALVTDLTGPVDYPYAGVRTEADLDAQVDRLQGVPEDPYLIEVNLLQAAWEAVEQVRKEQKIPARVAMQISRGPRGQYTGQRSQVNAAEMLYAMAQELALMGKQGLPDKVPFRRVKMAAEESAANAAGSAPGWLLETVWNAGEARKLPEREITRPECLETANYLLAAWTAGHLGHTEDIGGPPYGLQLSSGRKLSLNDAFQALAYSLIEHRGTGKMPEKVTIREVLGPVDHPMYDLRTEPAYNARLLRGGWTPYQMDVHDFPLPDLINVQGLPGPGHGSYDGFVAAGPLMASVEQAVKRLRATGIVPGSVKIELPQGRKYPRASEPTAYLNAAELLWGMSQLYRYIEVLGRPDDIYLRSCRLIKDQLHYYVVGFSPIGYSRAIYEYRRDGFDWIEKVPAWRIDRTWSRRP